jgi:hypothetical protein
MSQQPNRTFVTASPSPLIPAGVSTLPMGITAGSSPTDVPAWHRGNKANPIGLAEPVWSQIRSHWYLEPTSPIQDVDDRPA